MSHITYKIEFFTYWQTGTGLSGGAEANQIAAKDDNNLPLIPGRILKGMLSDAAHSLNELPSQLVTLEFIQKVFGVGEDSIDAKKAAKSECHFSSAQLSEYISKQLDNDQKKLLFRTLASTAIDKAGQAKDGSLRQSEVTIPLTLYASIENFPDEPNYKDQLIRCFQWVKKMGMNRNRGLGRCQFSLHN